jgi:hypothetical protein
LKCGTVEDTLSKGSSFKLTPEGDQEIAKISRLYFAIAIDLGNDNNEATGIWITTINMSQKEAVNKSNAAKYLKAFSFQTEREARESGKF